MPRATNSTGATAPRRRSNRLIVAALLACIPLLVAACGGSDGDAAPGPTGPPDATRGEQVYADRCAACHGRDFQGSAQAPSHLDPHFRPEVTSDEDYRNAIKEGADDPDLDYTRMPGLNLNDQEIADVIAYIRSVQDERGFNEAS
ncbi:MAG: c-type cytochrome [Microthrixaceae bacterium]